MGNPEPPVILDGLMELLEKERLSSNNLHSILEARRFQPPDGRGQKSRTWDMSPSQVAAMQTQLEEKDRWIRNLEDIFRNGRVLLWQDSRSQRA